MLKRHTDNTNIKQYKDQQYQGYPVLQCIMSEPYLGKIKTTIDRALQEHPRTLAIRFDLRFPQWMGEVDTAMISRFLASLRAKIDADLRRKSCDGSRVYPCTLRHIWAREQDSSHHWHYHCVIFLNRDAYFTRGDITAEKGNTAARIQQAWASALGVDFYTASGLVDFTRDGVFHLDAHSLDLNHDAGELFKAASYLAKVVTKHYGDGTKNFSCSNI